MRKFKIIFFTGILGLIVSCQTYKIIYVPTDGVTAKKGFSSILKENQLFLVFAKSYGRSKVKVVENDKIIFDSLMPAPRKNTAQAFKVNINSVITISFDDIKKTLTILPEQMEKYKFIYIEKKKKKVSVEFINGTKIFDDKPDLD